MATKQRIGREIPLKLSDCNGLDWAEERNWARLHFRGEDVEQWIKRANLLVTKAISRRQMLKAQRGTK